MHKNYVSDMSGCKINEKPHSNNQEPFLKKNSVHHIHILISIIMNGPADIYICITKMIPFSG